MRRGIRRAVQASIMISYAIPLLAVLEFGFTGRIIIVTILAVATVLFMFIVKDRNGDKLFSSEKLNKRGPIYYFPLSLADDI